MADESSYLPAEGADIADAVAKVSNLTKAKLEAIVIGIGDGYKIARSAAPVALGGTNPTTFQHGLTTCLAVFTQLVGSAAPGVSTSVLTTVIDGADVDVHAWKPTSNADPTLIASEGTEDFNWFAFGT